ncbi:MAG: YtxH domain-containing protein [Nitrospira sp. BO4]|jgi:gas vesicle protein|nr:YtxH domain-containing protein [Nitrospira sp. BO4]
MHNAIEWFPFRAGALLGAAAVLLFAPQWGTELRATFCNYVNRVKDDFREWDEEIYDMEEEILADPEPPTREFAKPGQEAVSLRR